MRGQVFEKVGVNVTMCGHLQPQFKDATTRAGRIAGNFRPAAFTRSTVFNRRPRAQNLRYPAHESCCFGGGSDLTPNFPTTAEDTASFHDAPARAPAILPRGRVSRIQGSMRPVLLSAESGGAARSRWKSSSISWRVPIRLQTSHRARPWGRRSSAVLPKIVARRRTGARMPHARDQLLVKPWAT